MAQYNLGKVSISPQGQYQATNTYNRLDVVYYNNSGYICMVDDCESEPTPTNTDWMLLVDGSNILDKKIVLIKYNNQFNFSDILSKALSGEYIVLCQKGYTIAQYATGTKLGMVFCSYSPTGQLLIMTATSIVGGGVEWSSEIKTFQDSLVSGENIKTINGESILGEGNITIQGGTGGSNFIGFLGQYTKYYYANWLNALSVKGEHANFENIRPTRANVGDIFIITASAYDTDDNYIFFMKCVEPMNQWLRGQTLYCHKFKNVNVIDNVESESSTDALSARMGKQLNDALIFTDDENDWEATQNFQNGITVETDTLGKFRIGYNSPNAVIDLSFAETEQDEVGGIHIAQDYVDMHSGSYYQSIYVDDERVALNNESANININQTDIEMYADNGLSISAGNVVDINSNGSLSLTAESAITTSGDSFTFNGDNVLTEGDINSLVPSYTDFQTVENKVNELELFKFPNATIFGQPTIQQGQISNFSSDNYLQFPFVVDFQNRPWELEFEVATSEDIEGQQNIIDSDFGLAFALNTVNGTKQFTIALGYNGTSWGEVNNFLIPRVPITTNKTFKFKIICDLTNYEVYTFITEGKPYMKVATIPYTAPLAPKTITIGKSIDNQYIWKGSINLNNAKLTISDKVVWQGMDDAGLSTRMAVNMNNIDDEGKQVVKDVVKEDFISKPQTEGTNGQVLTSNGDGTQSWQDVQGGGDDTMQRLLAGQTNYILYEDINGDIKQVKSHNTTSHPIWANPNIKKVLCGTFDALNYAFYNCTNLEEIYPTIVLSSNNNADYQNAFQKTPKLKKLDLSHIDFTQITQLVSTFNGCGLEEINIDTPNVVTFNGSFGGCRAKKLKFDVTDKCTSWQGQVLMYSGNLEILDTTSWDMINLSKLEYQELYGCSKLHSLIGEHTIEEVENGDIVAMKNLNVSFSLKPYNQTIPLDRASMLALIKGLADVNDKEEKPTLYLASYHRNLLSQEELDIATNKGWTIE